MLAYQWHEHSSGKSESGIPVVFLHGLLGSQQDWESVLKKLQNFPTIRPLTIDLPFHGKSETIACADFNDACQQLHQTLQSQIGDQPFWLVGYSLGGRIALNYSLAINNPNCLGTIVEGANIGLQTEQEKAQRWQNDLNWANRFENEATEMVLKDWYQQAVFSDLDFAKRAALIEKRKMNSGKNIAQMLKATSLAKQDFLLAQIQQRSDIYFMIGEKDQKFRHQAEQYQLNYQLVENAGHNSHRENSANFVEKLTAILIA